MCIRTQSLAQVSPAYTPKITISSKAAAFLRKDENKSILVYRSNGVDFSLLPTPQGVDYFSAAGDRQFAVETQFGETLYGSCCHNGNEKLWRNTLILDLCAGTLWFCPYDCKGCYAKTQQKLYANTYNHRLLNSWLAISNPSLLFQYVDECIKKYRPEYFRIHASGEIPSLAYCIEICKLAVKWKGICKFYMFTKKPQYIPMLDAAGVNVVRSSMIDSEGNTWINYGDRHYIKEFRKRFPMYKMCPAILPSGEVRKEKIKTKSGKIKLVHKIRCGRDCDLCSRYRYVGFYYHTSKKHNDIIEIERPAIVASTSEIVASAKPAIITAV